MSTMITDQQRRSNTAPGEPAAAAAGDGAAYLAGPPAETTDVAAGPLPPALPAVPPKVAKSGNPLRCQPQGAPESMSCRAPPPHHTVAAAAHHVLPAYITSVPAIAAADRWPLPGPLRLMPPAAESALGVRQRLPRLPAADGAPAARMMRP